MIAPSLGLLAPLELGALADDPLVAPRILWLTRVEDLIRGHKPLFVAGVYAVVELDRRSVLEWYRCVVYGQARAVGVGVIRRQRLVLHGGIAVRHLPKLVHVFGSGIELDPRTVWPRGLAAQWRTGVS